MRLSSLLMLHSRLIPCPLHIFSWSLAAVFQRMELEICDTDIFWRLEVGNTLLLWQQGEAEKEKKKLKSCTEQRERKKTVSWQSYWQGCLNKIKEASKKRKQGTRTRFQERAWELLVNQGLGLCSVSLLWLQTLVMAKAPKLSSRGRGQLQPRSRGSRGCWASANTEEVLHVWTDPCHCYCM